MNKTEAIKACLEGKKVTNKEWASKTWIEWTSSSFRDEANKLININHVDDDGYSIVPEKIVKDVWVNLGNIVSIATSFENSLFGKEVILWSYDNSSRGSIKYRITVEELPED